MSPIADRTVKVSIVANAAGYVAGIDQAAKKTRDLGSEAEKLAQKKQGFETIGHAAMGVGLAMAVGVAAATKSAADFDQAMSYVQAATHETAGNMGLLREAALQAGKDTAYSATEAANAIEELSKAGVSTSAILSGGLNGALDLAAAGGLDVARAAEIAATTLQQFGLKGSDAGHVADVLAAGAGKAMGSVDDLAQGMKYVGPVAKSMGISLEETAGTMALFAQQGIIGEQAGTSLRGVLSSLTSPSSAASKEIERLGINLYDSQGKFLGLENAAGQLANTYRGMDDASRNASMGIIFGRETVTAATALYTAGAEGVADWTKKVDDSGYAADTAAMRLDNLKGDFEQLSGSIETAFIKAGSGANDVLRSLTQGATDAVNAFVGMPQEMQTASIGIGAVGSAAALAVGAFLTGVPKVAEFRKGLNELGPAGKRAAGAAVGVAKGLALIAAAGGAVMVLDKLANASVPAASGIEQTTKALQSFQQTDLLFKGLGGDVDDFASGLEILTGDSIDANMERFGDTMNGIFFGGQLADQVKSTREQFDTIGQSLAQMVEAGNGEKAAGIFSEMAKQAREQGVSTSELLAQMPAYRDALAGVTNETDAAATASDANATALAGLSGQAQSTNTDISTLADTIRGFGSAELSTRDAARQFEESLDALSESVSKNGTSLDITTEKGRANEAALDAIAQAALGSAGAIMEQTGSQDQASAAVARGREELIKQLAQFKITGADAERYADKLGLIPGNINTATSISINWDAINAYVSKLNNIPAFKSTVINQVWKETGAPHGQVGAAYNANGGIVEFYAGGGMRENHIAQFAAAGTYRVWAEDETGGEAYIPLAQSKRTRSLAVLASTADRFGYSVTPKGAPLVASAPHWGGSGGPSGAVAAGAGMTVNLTTVNPVAERTSDTVARASQTIGALVEVGG